MAVTRWALHTDRYGTWRERPKAPSLFRAGGWIWHDRLPTRLTHTRLQSTWDLWL